MRTSSSYNYFDIHGLDEPHGQDHLRLGVEQHPGQGSADHRNTTNLPGTSGNGNTFPQTYDALAGSSSRS